jgi:hypothetical protein
MRQAKATPPPAKPTVLMVEDTASYMLQRVPRLVQSGKWNVVLAFSLESALRQIDRYRGKIDILDIDTVFPESMSKETILSELKNDTKVFARGKSEKDAEFAYKTVLALIQDAADEKEWDIPPNAGNHGRVAGWQFSDLQRKAEISNPHNRPILIHCGANAEIDRRAPFDSSYPNIFLEQDSEFNRVWNECSGDLRRLDEKRSEYRGCKWLQDLKKTMRTMKVE